MKAVLLTCNTGQGHNAAALAIGNALTARGVECVTLDALAFLGENVSEAIAGMFVNIAVKTPRAFGFMYQAGEFISSDKRKSPVYYANALYAENLHRYLVDNAIDAAICPHLFPAEALSYLRRQRDLATRAYFVSTDYTCIPFLEETDMDAIFVPHEDLVPLFIRRGVPADSLIVSGIPVLDKYRYSTSQADARNALDLPPDVPCYLMMTGGEGCGDPVSLTRKLIERCRGIDVRIIVMTGRNAHLGETLRRRFEGDPRVVTVPFTEQVSLYMDACDVLLTKPGGISTTEAAVKCIPMIHTAPIPGCETLNAQFFAERGMSILAPNPDSAADNAIRLGHDARQRARMRDAQQQYMVPNALDRICNIICGTEFHVPVTEPPVTEPTETAAPQGLDFQQPLEAQAESAQQPIAAQPIAEPLAEPVVQAVPASQPLEAPAAPVEQPVAAQPVAEPVIQAVPASQLLETVAAPMQQPVAAQPVAEPVVQAVPVSQPLETVAAPMQQPVAPQPVAKPVVLATPARQPLEPVAPPMEQPIEPQIEQVDQQPEPQSDAPKAASAKKESAAPKADSAKESKSKRDSKAKAEKPEKAEKPAKPAKRSKSASRAKEEDESIQPETKTILDAASAELPKAPKIPPVVPVASPTPAPTSPVQPEPRPRHTTAPAYQPPEETDVPEPQPSYQPEETYVPESQSRKGWDGESSLDGDLFAFDPSELEEDAPLKKPSLFSRLFGGKAARPPKKQSQWDDDFDDDDFDEDEDIEDEPVAKKKPAAKKKKSFFGVARDDDEDDFDDDDDFDEDDDVEDEPIVKKKPAAKKKKSFWSAARDDDEDDFDDEDDITDEDEDDAPVAKKKPAAKKKKSFWSVDDDDDDDDDDEDEPVVKKKPVANKKRPAKKATKKPAPADDDDDDD